MGTALDVAQLIVPGVTALGGAAWGARSTAAGAEKAELRALLDEATAVLERANQRRGVAYVYFIQDGVKTTDAGREAIKAFGEELSQAAQIRDALVFRTKKGAAVSVHYINALLALSRVSTALGVVASWPPDNLYLDLVKQHEAMTGGESDFNEEKAKFVEAAQDYIRPRSLADLRARVRRRT